MKSETGTERPEPQSRIDDRIAEMHGRAERLSPLDIQRRMDAIQEVAGNCAADSLLSGGDARQLRLFP